MAKRDIRRAVPPGRDARSMTGRALELDLGYAQAGTQSTVQNLVPVPIGTTTTPDTVESYRYLVVTLLQMERSDSTAGPSDFFKPQDFADVARTHIDFGPFDEYQIVWCGETSGESANILQPRYLDESDDWQDFGGTGTISFLPSDAIALPDAVGSGGDYTYHFWRSGWSDLPDALTNTARWVGVNDTLQGPKVSYLLELHLRGGAIGSTVGDKGPDGDKGPQGDKGPVGNKGVDGDKGPVGDKGPTGDAGADGTDGSDGTDGADGDKGPVGDKGPTGDKGADGDKGPAGDAGVTPDPNLGNIWDVDTVVSAGVGGKLGQYLPHYAAAPVVLSTTQTLADYGGDPRPRQYILQATGGAITVTLPSVVFGKILYFYTEIAGGSATVTGAMASLGSVTMTVDDFGIILIGGDSQWRVVGKFDPTVAGSGSITSVTGDQGITVTNTTTAPVVHLHGYSAATAGQFLTKSTTANQNTWVSSVPASISAERNGAASQGPQPLLNFIDNGALTWAITNNSGASRIDITPTIRLFGPAGSFAATGLVPAPSATATTTVTKPVLTENGNWSYPVEPIYNTVFDHVGSFSAMDGYFANNTSNILAIEPFPGGSRTFSIGTNTLKQGTRLYVYNTGCWRDSTTGTVTTQQPLSITITGLLNKSLGSGSATPFGDLVLAPGEGAFLICAQTSLAGGFGDKINEWIVVGETRLSLRQVSRSLTSASTTAEKNVRTFDRYLSLEGTVASSIAFHLASDTARQEPIKVRNNSTQNWTLSPFLFSSDLFYQGTSGAGTITLTPGQSITLWNRTAAVWEVI